MKKSKKNSSTGLYTLQIGNNVFESKRAKLFIVSLNDIEQILVNDLPFNIKFLLKRQVRYGVDLLLNRSSTDMIEICISENATTRYWYKTIDLANYFKFKGELIFRNLSIRPNINISAGFTTDIVFDYSIQLNVTTLGEAVKAALETNKSLDDRIDYASEKALGCMELVLGGGFQIDVSNIFSGKDKNTKV